jgi:hypothetical protein
LVVVEAPGGEGDIAAVAGMGSEREEGFGCGRSICSALSSPTSQCASLVSVGIPLVIVSNDKDLINQ